jgi:hypothetical protein
MVAAGRAAEAEPDGLGWVPRAGAPLVPAVQAVKAAVKAAMAKVRERRCTTAASSVR